MNKSTLKKIKESNILITNLYNLISGFFTWFLNYVISIIPFWCVRKFFYIIYGMKIGKGSRIGIHTRIVKPCKIRIGDRTIINEFCHIDGRGGLIIGDDCSVSIYTKMITASHKSYSDSFEYYENGIIIEDHVWTGCNAVILDGSIIKSGCIIGAGSIIKGETEEKSIYVGNPAKRIKERECNLSYQINYHPYFK